MLFIYDPGKYGVSVRLRLRMRSKDIATSLFQIAVFLTTTHASYETTLTPKSLNDTTFVLVSPSQLPLTLTLSSCFCFLLRAHSGNFLPLLQFSLFFHSGRGIGVLNSFWNRGRLKNSIFFLVTICTRPYVCLPLSHFFFFRMVITLEACS